MGESDLRKDGGGIGPQDGLHKREVKLNVDFYVKIPRTQNLKLSLIVRFEGLHC